MKRYIWLLLALLLPTVVLAQAPDLEEVTTEDGYFTVALPADWAVSTTDGLGVSAASSPEALTKIEDSASIEDLDLQEGDLGFVTIILPADVLAAFQELLATMPTPEADSGDNDLSILNIFTPESTPEEMAQRFADLLLTAADETEAVQPELGEIEVIELEEDLEAGVLLVFGETYDALIVAYMREGDAVGAIAVAPKGGIEGNEDLFYAIFASIQLDESLAQNMLSEMGLE
jgi:hypothetical protein